MPIQLRWMRLGCFVSALVFLAVGSAPAQAERVLEMVSPPSKNNASILSAMAIDSDHVAILSSGSIFESDPFYTGSAEYVASRVSTSGWGLEFSPIARDAILIDHLASNDRIFQSFSPLLVGEVDDGGTDVYRWTSGSLSLVSAGGTGAFEASYLTASNGGDHILFSTAEALDARDVDRTAGTMLYERTGSQTRAVGLDSAGQPVSEGGAILAGDGSGALTAAGDGGVSHPISVDGSRIFFESPDPAAGGDTQLYVRENGQTTTMVSASQRTIPGNGPLPARFEGASADGSRVLFRTGAQLVDDDVDEYADLYRYDVATHALVRVSTGQADADSSDCAADGEDGLHGVCGVVAMSDDARRVYYLSTGALPSGGVAGYLNLYLYDADTDATTFVLSAPNDLNGVFDDEVRSLIQGGLRRALPKAEATPDGSVLVFAADTPLTGFDNTSAACPADALNPEGRCTEVYRYDAVSRQLACLSCNAAGLPPLGPAELPVSPFAPRPERRFLTADGSMVAFETADALVPADDNGQADVYEWRNRAVSLVSSGTSSRRATLAGIGPDGQDIFFLTAASLVDGDTDTLTDLYDARLGGGFSSPPPPAGPCAESDCQGAPGPAPELSAPLSNRAGGGNVVPPRRATIALVRVAPRRAGRRLGVTVRVNAAGRVSISAAARLATRRRAIGRTSKQVDGARKLTLIVKLDGRARRELRRKRRLTVNVTARLSKAPREARQSITIRAVGLR